MVNPARKIGDALTSKEQAFVDQVVKGEPLIDAYVTAYKPKPTALGETVRRTAYAVAKRPIVAAAIKAGHKRVSEHAELEGAIVLREIARLALFDPRGIVHREGPRKGALKTLDELDDATAAGIASFEISELGAIKYKFHSKTAALEQAAKHLGLFERDNEQKKDPLTSLLAGLAGNVVGVAKDVGPAISMPDDED